MSNALATDTSSSTHSVVWPAVVGYVGSTGHSSDRHDHFGGHAETDLRSTLRVPHTRPRRLVMRFLPRAARRAHSLVGCHRQAIAAPEVVDPPRDVPPEADLAGSIDGLTVFGSRELAC